MVDRPHNSKLEGALLIPCMLSVSSSLYKELRPEHQASPLAQQGIAALFLRRLVLNTSVVLLPDFLDRRLGMQTFTLRTCTHSNVDSVRILVSRRSKVLVYLGRLSNRPTAQIYSDRHLRVLASGSPRRFSSYYFLANVSDMLFIRPSFFGFFSLHSYQ